MEKGEVMSAERILQVSIDQLKFGDVILDSWGDFDNYGDWVTVYEVDLIVVDKYGKDLTTPMWRLNCDGRVKMVGRVPEYYDLNISRTIQNRGSYYYD